MQTLPLKLLLTPTLIAAASLAGRRWGPAVGGWLVGLPFTSAPVALIVTLTHGVAFGSSVAVGTLAGTASQVGFAAAYAWSARRLPWPLALACACAGFGACTALLEPRPLPLLPVLALVVAVLLAGLVVLPRQKSHGPATRGAYPAWDLPARMAAATTLVVVLTTTAPLLGAHLTGLLTPFPLYATVLRVFGHRQHGPEAAIGALRGLVLGLFAFAAFFSVLGALLVRGGALLGFAAALAAALSVQSVSLLVVRRRPAVAIEPSSADAGVARDPQRPGAG
jgi:hypothetical protein